MRELLKKIIDWIWKILKELFHFSPNDLPYYITIFVAFLIFVSGLTFFIELTEELVENDLHSFDHAVSDFVVSFRRAWLTSLMIIITWIGNLYGYVTLLVVLMLYFVIRHQNWRSVLQTVTVLILASLCNVILKLVIGRERPEAQHLVEVSSLSYPSGHAMSAAGFYGFLIFLAVRYPLSRTLRIVLVSLLSIMIFLIGISRIYLGVHYPSDVLAGFIGGGIWVAFCVIVFEVIDLLRKRKIKTR